MSGRFLDECGACRDGFDEDGSPCRECTGSGVRFYIMARCDCGNPTQVIAEAEGCRAICEDCFEAEVEAAS